MSEFVLLKVLKNSQNEFSYFAIMRAMTLTYSYNEGYDLDIFL